MKYVFFGEFGVVFGGFMGSVWKGSRWGGEVMVMQGEIGEEEEENVK